MTLRYFQLGGVLLATGAAMLLLHRSLRWYGDAQKSTAVVMELEKRLEASKASVRKLEVQVAELRVRGDEVQRRLSNEGTELVAAENQLEKCRGFLTACRTRKNTLEDQKRNDTKTIGELKAVQFQTLKDTRARLQLVQEMCAHVVAGGIEEARKLCQSVTLTQRDGSKPKAEKGRN